MADSPETTVHRYRSLFDESPIKIGGFEFRGTGAKPIVDRPTLGGWRAAFEFASDSERSSPYWVGDLLSYAETRAEWQELMDQALSATQFARQTIINRTSVSKRVTGRARELAPSFSHASVVASLEPAEQEELLEQARSEEWTTTELTHAKKARGRRVVGQGRTQYLHTCDVTVRIQVQAENEVIAQDVAWAKIRKAIEGISHAHVIGCSSHLREVPKVGRKRKGAAA